MNMRINMNTKHLALMINDRCYKYGRQDGAPPPGE